MTVFILFIFITLTLDKYEKNYSFISFNYCL